MSIFAAIIEAVTGHIQDPSDYEYEGDESDNDDLDDELTNESDSSDNKPWWMDWL